MGAHVREAGVAIRLMQRNAEGRGQLRRADALTVLAERFLAQVPEADESLNTADRFLITVHAPAKAPAEALPEHAGIDHGDPPQFEGGSVAAQEAFADWLRGTRVPRGYSSRPLPGRGAAAVRPP